MDEARRDQPAETMRRTALVAGALYLLTFVASIPTLGLYASVRGDVAFVLGAGNTVGATWGILLDVVLAIACVGTAVSLFPVAKRVSETAALGFLAARVVEAGLILVGATSLVTLLALRHDAAGTAAADPTALTTAARTLVGLYDAAFLLGQSLMPVVSALCLGSVLYRSGLVPRLIPAVGLAGAPLLLAFDIAILGGVYEQGTAMAGLAALPIAAWELALGLWLTAKGFRTTAALQLQGAARDPGPRTPAVHA